METIKQVCVENLGTLKRTAVGGPMVGNHLEASMHLQGPHSLSYYIQNPFVGCVRILAFCMCTYVVVHSNSSVDHHTTGPHESSSACCSFAFAAKAPVVGMAAAGVDRASAAMLAVAVGKSHRFRLPANAPLLYLCWPHHKVLILVFLSLSLSLSLSIYIYL
jgi:hypothetical protein